MRVATIRTQRILTLTFVELPPFERVRERYLDDDAFTLLQAALQQRPAVGAVVAGTGGIRKLRWPDPRRSKGKRGGLRVIYYWWNDGDEIWFFTIYDKGEKGDLSAEERRAIKASLEQELAWRTRGH